MAKLVYDQTNKKYFSAGVKDLALSVYSTTYSAYQAPVAWDGVISVAQSPSGAEATALYADNEKYLELFSAEEFGGTIEAYQAPAAFGACDGKATLTTAPGLKIPQQTRASFGFAYITQKGNDTAGTDFSEVLHLVYGAKASPSEASYETINDSPDAITFSWEFTCTPITDTSVSSKPIYHMEVSKLKRDGSGSITHWDDLIDYIYGTASTNPAFPTPAQVVSILKTGSV